MSSGRDTGRETVVDKGSYGWWIGHSIMSFTDWVCKTFPFGSRNRSLALAARAARKWPPQKGKIYQNLISLTQESKRTSHNYAPCMGAFDRWLASLFDAWNPLMNHHTCTLTAYLQWGQSRWQSPKGGLCGPPYIYKNDHPRAAPSNL